MEQAAHHGELPRARIKSTRYWPKVARTCPRWCIFQPDSAGALLPGLLVHFSAEFRSCRILPFFAAIRLVDRKGREVGRSLSCPEQVAIACRGEVPGSVSGEGAAEVGRSVVCGGMGVWECGCRGMGVWECGGVGVDEPVDASRHGGLGGAGALGEPGKPVSASAGAEWRSTSALASGYAGQGRPPKGLVSPARCADGGA